MNASPLVRGPAVPRASAGRGVVLGLSLAAAAVSCGPPAASSSGGAEPAGAMAATPSQAQRLACEASPEGITLAPGFCAITVADSLGRARHIAVAPNGDLFVAMNNARGVRGGVAALRDTTNDGRVDVVERFGDNGGTGIALHGNWLYFATNDAVLRYPLRAGALQPTGAPDTVVMALPADRGHPAKSIAIGRDGALYVNIGSPSNMCSVQNQPQPDPCPELEHRAGIWRFDANRLRQTQSDGRRYATGIRNAVGITINPATGTLFAVQHGRDNLHRFFPQMYTEQQSAESPSEELQAVHEGDDFGWPYCYHDNAVGRKLLTPEYGGDGRTQGRCAQVEEPAAYFPGHWAPNSVAFYTGTQFPARYRGGAFIAFHGSWNRAPQPQAGYNVAFVPMQGDRATGPYEVFADGFAGENVAPNTARFRPTAVAMANDGGLYIVDGQVGRIWKVMYVGR